MYLYSNAAELLLYLSANQGHCDSINSMVATQTGKAKGKCVKNVQVRESSGNNFILVLVLSLIIC